MEKEKIFELKTLLEEEETISSEIRVKREAFEKQLEDQLQLQLTIREQVATSKMLLSDDAIVEFQKTGEKKLMGGIGIRVGVGLIYDEIPALEWAKQHNIALQLDKKKFESIAKLDNADMDFLEKEEKVTVTFPKEIKLED